MACNTEIMLDRAENVGSLYIGEGASCDLFEYVLMLILKTGLSCLLTLGIHTVRNTYTKSNQPGRIIYLTQESDISPIQFAVTISMMYIGQRTSRHGLKEEQLIICHPCPINH